MRRISVCIAITLIGAICFLFSVGGFAAEQKTADTPKPAAPASPPPPTDIPLADIATRATEVSNLVGSLTASSTLDAQTDAIAKSLTELSVKLDAQFESTTIALDASPSLETLQTLQQQWQSRQVETTAWLNTLTERATKLQAGLSQLADLQKTWSATPGSGGRVYFLTAANKGFITTQVTPKRSSPSHK